MACMVNSLTVSGAGRQTRVALARAGQGRIRSVLRSSRLTASRARSPAPRDCILCIAETLLALALALGLGPEVSRAVVGRHDTTPV